MATKKKTLLPDLRCEHCHGKGWIRASNGWPVECRCLIPPLLPKKKPATAPSKPVMGIL